MAGRLPFARLLADNPWATRVGSYTALLAGADLAGQAAMGARRFEDIDWHEVARMAIYGGVFSAPLVHSWYIASSRLLGEAAIGASLRARLASVAPKVIAEQALLSPTTIVVAIAWNGVATGKSPSYIRSKLGQDLVPAWKRCAAVWSVASTANYFFVPPHLRVFPAMVVAAGWNAYLSVVSNRAVRPEAHDADLLAETRLAKAM
mmetsp:Transcript_13069/g.45702  ORF Transcript_13069/g.45702 Transcript_13069/m.45702 type:complete len:205 (-) Transcript_13069:198-812(-)